MALADPRIELGSLALQADSLPAELTRKPLYTRGNGYSQGIRPDRVPEGLWTGLHDIVQEAVIKTIPKKKKCKKAKWLSEVASQIAKKR